MKEFMIVQVNKASEVLIGTVVGNYKSLLPRKKLFDSLEEAYKAVREHMEYMKDVDPRERSLVVVCQSINNSDK